jgi:hypothetical protein
MDGRSAYSIVRQIARFIRPECRGLCAINSVGAAVAADERYAVVSGQKQWVAVDMITAISRIFASC